MATLFWCLIQDGKSRFGWCFRRRLSRGGKNKKGGRCKPPFYLNDPPKPEHSRGCVPASPGSQYFICGDRVQVGCQLPNKTETSAIWLIQLELDEGNFSRTWRERIKPTKSHRCPAPFLQSLGETICRHLAQAPMVARIAEAMDWLKRSTSVACSASTMTRASGSVPE